MIILVYLIVMVDLKRNIDKKKIVYRCFERFWYGVKDNVSVCSRFEFCSELCGWVIGFLKCWKKDIG